MTSNTPVTQALLPVTPTAKEREIANSFGAAWNVNAAMAYGIANLLAQHRHRLASLPTPTAEPMGDETLRAALATIQAMIGNVDHSRGHGPNAAEMRGGMLNDIRDLCNRALTTPPTPDRIGKDAVREAEAWLRAISDWLLANDHDMTLPSGVLDKDPLDIADSLAALSATPAQPVDETERLRAAIIKRRDSEVAEEKACYAEGRPWKAHRYAAQILTELLGEAK